MRCKFLEQKTNFKTSSSKEYLDSLCTKAKFGGLPSWHLISSPSTEGERRLTNFGRFRRRLSYKATENKKGILPLTCGGCYRHDFHWFVKRIVTFWKKVLSFDTPRLGFFFSRCTQFKKETISREAPPPNKLCMGDLKTQIQHPE